MRSRSFLILFALLASAAAVVFLAISVDHQFYAPGVHTIEHDVRRVGAHAGVPWQYTLDAPIATALRKLYSIVAFSVLGLLAAPLIERRARLGGDIVLVASFSAVIELAQKMSGSTEGLRWNAFDIGCGALGGAIGALAWNAGVRALRGRKT